MALRCLRCKKLDDAKAALKHALALDAKSAQAWYNLGLALAIGQRIGAGDCEFSASGED